MHNNPSILGSDWFKTFRQFRVNPETFFDKRKLTREAFCLDVLRDIYRDHIDNQCKSHLLLLLQEHSATLVKDINLLEQISGSLINLFSILKRNNEKKIIRSQILTTITTVILTSEIEDETEELLKNVKNLLLSVILDKNEVCIIVSAACQCLEEIEECFPKSLESETKVIFSSSEKHLSPAFQNYATLLSLCAKNSCLKSSELKILENEEHKLDHEKDEIQLPFLVSYLMELVPLMSSLSVYRVLKNLIPVVKFSSSIKCVVFKHLLPSLIFSFEVPYIHLAFDFLEAFKQELFTPQEEKCLIKQLMLLSSHPCLTLSHRMLFLDWLKICLQDKELFSSPFPFLKNLLPGPFDGPITQEKKSCVLALCVPRDVGKTVGLEFLDESVSGLKRCALLPNGYKASASFFRTLFVYFSHLKPELVHSYTYKLLLGIMKTSPHLLKHALSFLDAVKTEFPESTFAKETLAHMVDHILSLPMKQFTNNLECYLAILEQASEVCGSECKPRSILRLLQKLLNDSELHKRKIWEFGNNILSVCRSILNFHDVQIFYYDLAEVLCLISQNIEDVDVKDRAKIYYSILTTLSKLKIQTIFNIQSPEKDLKNSLSSFVPGENSKLQFAPCVQFLSKPILEIVRIKKKWSSSSENANNHLSVPNFDILKVYKQHIDSSDSVVQLPFILKSISESEKTFSSLYGVTISSFSSPPSKKISVIQIPVLKLSRTVSEENTFYLNITPFESHPMELHFKSEFTCNKGYNYICPLDSVYLNFKDFFLPVPVPQCLQNCDSSWKKVLFEVLWEEFQKDVPFGSDDGKSCKSAVCLNMKKEELAIILDEHWKQFIVAKFDDFKYWVAVFLPPSNHLLMKIETVNDKPFINIAVDNISNLPWIALYLKEITKCQSL